MSDRLCDIEPLHVGICTVGKRHVLGDDYSDEERILFAMYSFYVRSPDGQKTLVDLGPKTLEYANNMFHVYGFFRDEAEGEKNPDDIRQPYGNIFDHLERLGIGVDEIDHIVFSHMHADHHGIDDARDGGAVEDFPNATFHVSGRGWEWNHSRRTEEGWNTYLDYAFGDAMLRMEREGRLVARDDVDVAPGVRTVYLGGHAVCSQGIRIETAYGPALATSDDMYHYSLLAEGVLARLLTTPENLMASTEKMVEFVERESGILLPVHDPLLWKLWEERGGEWLAGARERSVEAARGYRLRQKQGRVRVAGLRS